MQLSVTRAALANVELLPVPVTRSSTVAVSATFQCGAAAVVNTSLPAPVDVPIGSCHRVAGSRKVYGPLPLKYDGGRRR